MDEATREAIYEAMQELQLDPQAAKERQHRLNEDLKFALDHTEEWRLAYPDQWIAVFGCKLIAVAPDEQQLVGAVLMANAPLDETYLDFLPREKHLMML